MDDKGAICPACGRSNDCQMARDGKCRCFNVQADKLKLECVLKDKSKDQCLCKACLNEIK